MLRLHRTCTLLTVLHGRQSVDWSHADLCVCSAAGQAKNQAKVVMNRTNPRICIRDVEIRGEDSNQQVGFSRTLRAMCG